MKDVQCVALIQTELLLAGTGKDGSPFRRVTQWWTMDGDLVVEKDPASVVVSVENQQQIMRGIENAVLSDSGRIAAKAAVLEVLNRLRP